VGHCFGISNLGFLLLFLVLLVGLAVFARPEVNSFSKRPLSFVFVTVTLRRSNPSPPPNEFEEESQRS